MKTPWQVKSYTSSLGETGDHFTECWIENGELKLIASSDLESDEELHEIADALNSFESLDQQNKELSVCACKVSDTPCGPNCTCKNPVMSGGCLNCATYGNEEQRKNMAEDIQQRLAEIQRLTKEVEEYKVVVKNYDKIGSEKTETITSLRDENGELESKNIALEQAVDAFNYEIIKRDGIIKENARIIRTDVE